MANKNSQARRRAIARAAKESFRSMRRQGGTLEISHSDKRNMRQVCYRNPGGGSITVHEPIWNDRRTRPKNHKYLEFRYKEFVKGYGGTKSRSEAPAEGFAFDNTVVHV